MAVGSEEHRDMPVLSVEEEVVGVLELIVEPPFSSGLGTWGRASEGNLPPQPLLSLKLIRKSWDWDSLPQLSLTECCLNALMISSALLSLIHSTMAV